MTIQTSHLKHINSGLLAAIIAVNAYIILAPVVPAAIFWLEQHTTSRLSQLTVQLHAPVTLATPSDNRLVAPAMLLDEPIFDGPTIATANKGIWRRPATSTPDQGGNTVLVGHRFTYTNPRGTFYYLDKLIVGDELGVFWQRKAYLYKVKTVTVVPPSQESVEANTAQSQLTLYTCTPLWWPKNRLVVVAALESQP